MGWVAVLEDGWFGGSRRSGDGMGIPPPETQQMQQKEQSWRMWWKALHVLSSLCLAGWVPRGTGWRFTGSALERAKLANMSREEALVFITYYIAQAGFILFARVCANFPLHIAFFLVLHHYAVP